ncbi:MAG: hypothetical protein RLZZ543_760 [Bacteroidota bacterium]|jgi:CubicO group peptidase (beta-lactamase class C family)
MRTLLLLIALFLHSVPSFGQDAQYKAIVNRYSKEKKLSGVVLVAKKGKVAYIQSVGFADKETQRPMNAQTRFRIASMTKTFTAVLVMKLYEEGKIQLNAPISTYIPNYTGEGMHIVNIHHLLTYSSGIEDLTESLGMAPFEQLMTVDEYIRRYCSGRVIDGPGNESKYSNTEYVLLHKILENVSGKSYSTLLQEYILSPLKMTNTGVISSNTPNPKLAKTYSYDDSTNVFTKDAPYFGENYFGSANMYSTVEDMLLFNNALFGRKLLSDSTTNTMLTIHEELGYTAYGLWGSRGWGDFKEPFYYRTGGTLGATSNWIHTLDSQTTIIVMSNNNATDLYGFSAELYVAGSKAK